MPQTEPTPSLPPEHFYGRLERRGVFGSLTLTQYRYEPRQSLPQHHHQEAFLGVVLEGAFAEHVATTTRECERGAVIVHWPNESHRDQVSHDGARILNVSLGSDVWRRVAELPRREWPRVGVHRGAASAIALRLQARFRSSAAAAHSLAVEGLALTLLAECCGDGVVQDARAPRWLATVLDLLRESAPHGVSLQCAADAVGVHPTHLARTFHRHAGETFGDHIRRLRVAWAMEAILAGDRPLSRIALDAGFADQAHFCRVFRRATGLTPGRFRRDAGC